MTEQKSRLSVVKNKQKQKKNRRNFFKENKKNLVIFGVVFVVLICAYFGSSVSKVKTVEVEGLNELGEQQVIDASKINTNTLMLSVLFTKSQYQDNILNNLKSVKSASVQFKSINQLKIHVKEYETVGYIAKNDQYYKILVNGKKLTQGQKLPIGNHPIFVDFKDKKILDQTITEYSKLNAKMKNSISEIKYTPSDLNKYKARLFMNDDNEVIVDIRTMRKKLVYYPSISSQMGKKGVVDLEIGAYSYPFS
ncbi:FtsQ-type POTRA domain-containing protein [Lactobacillus sp. YT155]|uniref:cell division protein FtsQ/DivIB n=1 Tax=Lactobacillus sp. YT155 TaxID=3060955 RepID=UPI00265F044E|nr:FtsQ-type POTRA domain-containing protein [Lactobacillus sp. YT155]MDO1605269.1 FtsQ-type POTRA domain-containing protein [Lactobacillus sp. YT155]